MKNPVNIKGTKSGIIVSLDNKMPYNQLIKEIKDKFTKSASFFGQASVALAFEGRKLSDDEKYEIAGIITECSELNIVCITEDNPDIENKMNKSLNDKLNELKENDAKTGKFYKGTLRNGQVINFDSSVIVLGDINAGAQIVSKGSIVILGKLNGSVFAGAGGNKNAFVAALNMNPTQIRICDTIARSPDNRTDNAKETEPKIAYCEDGNIYIEVISRESLNDIQL